MLMNDTFVIVDNHQWIKNDPFEGYYITYLEVPNGSTAGPVQVLPNRLVTVNVTPDSGFVLDYLIVNGQIIEGNTFIMPFNDVYIDAVFKLTTPATLRFKFYDTSYVPSSDSGAEWQSNITWSRVTSSPNVWDCTLTLSSSILDVFDFYGNKFRNAGDYEIVGGNTEGVRSWYNSFVDCYGLKKINQLTLHSDLDMTFQACSGLTDARLDVGEEVGSLHDGFAYCRTLSDVTINNTDAIVDMSGLFYGCYEITAGPELNTMSVTAMNAMFMTCTGMVEMPTYDTSNVVNMSFMLDDCRSLKNIPLFDTTNVTDVRSMCYETVSSDGGQLALYNQLSSQANPPTDYEDCFFNCGLNSSTGSAETSQIPDTWK